MVHINQLGSMSRLTQSIDYSEKMRRSLLRVMAEVLEDVAVDGLPGEHHFFITFLTTYPGVDMPDWLRAQHPSQMTIVIQNWYDDLVVSDNWFDITLSFSNQAVRLHIPFASVLTFVDPSVEFGLRFDNDESEDDVIDELIEVVEGAQKEEKKPSDADVVSLDSFRK